MLPMCKKDRIVGGLVSLIGIFLLLMIFLTIPDKAKGADPGPRLFPMLGSIGMLIFGAGIFFNASKGENAAKEAPVFLPRDGWIRIAKVTVIFVAYTLALKYIGFLIATPVFVFLITTLFAYEKKINIVVRILFSIATAVLIWLIFVKLLSVILPAGTLW